MVWSSCITRTQRAASAVSGARTRPPSSAELPSKRSSTRLSDPDRLSEDFAKLEGGSDLFNEMKRRFLNFKKHTYVKDFQNFQKMAEAQAPKVMVIACADSRVCPSDILGFQPGEALTVRNVANLVPPRQNGPSETNAALEFAVNTLQVENIFVIGHSNCGGIQALMSMHDDKQISSCLERWVMIGKSAKARAEEAAATSSLRFDQLCRLCEKESIDISMKNLMTYPWIEERVRKGVLLVHGGYYDLSKCTFEKWRLSMDGTKDSSKEFWS